MPRLGHRTGPIALAALLSACAHAPAAPLPPVVWPEAPAAPRARLVAMFPDPARPGPARPGWRRVLDAIAGADPAEQQASWLARPFGVALRADGSFVIADPDRPAVIDVTPRAEPRPVACKGRQWAAPIAVALGVDGSRWVADAGAAEVVRVGPDGGCTAFGKGVLERPTGVAVSGDRLFVVDPPRHVVVVLSVASGAETARLGGRGDGPGQLHYPTALALAGGGELLVVDALNFRIARFGPDGEWRGSFGEAGGSGGSFDRPKAIATDDAGRIYVTDAQRDAVLVYGPDGRFEIALGATGSEPGSLTMPAGVALAAGRFALADSLNRRVQVFELIGEAP
jgi:DNA-binding beta-propeller fold protein YncE